MGRIRALAAALLSAALLCLAGCALGEVVISEVMASNGYFEDGHAWDWVELHNEDKAAVDLSGWYLSDSKKDPLKWQFPEGARLKGGAYLTVLCTGGRGDRPGKGNTFFAGFAISSKGENLVLSDADGAPVQILKIPEQYGCVSYGKPADGGEYGFFEKATRGQKRPEAYPDRTAAPVIETAGGFYRDHVTMLGPPGRRGHPALYHGRRDTRGREQAPSRGRGDRA